MMLVSIVNDAHSAAIRPLHGFTILRESLDLKMIWIGVLPNGSIISF